MSFFSWIDPMAKEDFLMSVRTAVGTLLPRVDADHPYTDRNELEGILRRSVLWLSKSAVAGFERGGFDDLDPETRAVLDRDVSAFLDVASKVDPKGPATPDQVAAALPPFLEIAEITRKYTLDEWLKSAGGLTDQAAGWAEAEGWPTKRYRWTFTEPFLGTYELDRLIYGVMGSQLALIPIGRYTMRSKGVFDLAVMPAYESIMVSRTPKGRWMIDPLPGETKSRPWNASNFVDVSEKLSRMG
jgi:hypothetical protein